MGALFAVALRQTFLDLNTAVAKIFSLQGQELTMGSPCWAAKLETGEHPWRHV